MNVIFQLLWIPVCLIAIQATYAQNVSSDTFDNDPKPLNVHKDGVIWQGTKYSALIKQLPEENIDQMPMAYLERPQPFLPFPTNPDSSNQPFYKKNDGQQNLFRRPGSWPNRSFSFPSPKRKQE